MLFFFFFTAQRDRNGIKAFPLTCRVANAGCELRSLSSAVKMHQNWFVFEPLCFLLSPDILVTGAMRGECGRAGFWRLSGVTMPYIVAHSLSMDVLFFFSFFFPELCFSSTVSIGLEMAFNLKKACGLFIQELD